LFVQTAGPPAVAPTPDVSNLVNFKTVPFASKSGVGMLACLRAPVVLKVNGGVGYLIPQAVTKAINSILRAFNIRYELRGEGGLEPSEMLTVVDTESRAGGCAPAPATRPAAGST